MSRGPNKNIAELSGPLNLTIIQCTIVVKNSQAEIKPSKNGKSPDKNSLKGGERIQDGIGFWNCAYPPVGKKRKYLHKLENGGPQEEKNGPLKGNKNGNKTNIHFSVRNIYYMLILVLK